MGLFKKKEILNPATAKNAQIVWDNGKDVKYQPQCPKCGYQNLKLEKGWCLFDDDAFSAKCEKCSALFDVWIHRDFISTKKGKR